MGFKSLGLEPKGPQFTSQRAVCALSLGLSPARYPEVSLTEAIPGLEFGPRVLNYAFLLGYIAASSLPKT